MVLLKRAVVLLAVSMAAVAAQDRELAAMRLELHQLRTQPAPFDQLRGAMPQFTVIKHQLRDWIEHQLSEFDRRGEAKFEAGVNNQLRLAGLLCNACPQNRTGFLDQVKIQRKGDLLMVRTGVGIQMCGYDNSIYAYQRKGGAWSRIFEGEEGSYAKDDYQPGAFEFVEFSPADRWGRRVALTMGSEAWCTSTWHPTYFRIWRTAADGSAGKLLFRGTGKMSDTSNPIRGAVTLDEASVKFELIQPDGQRRTEVERYRIQGSGVERIKETR